MKSTLWMVQTNLGNSETHDAIKAACERNGLHFLGVKVVPFSHDLPNVQHDGTVLAYGATKFIKNVVDSGRWVPGAFFDESVFTASRCITAWGSHMLNADSALIELKNSGALSYCDDDLVFVRPDGDMKELAGEVMRFADLVSWSRIIDQGQFEFDGHLPIRVASPKNIGREWRVFVVNGRPVASTQYRVDGRLSIEAGAPSEVLAFVEARLKEWSPAPALALDIANVRDDLKIIEMSDLHSAGHYAADINAIIVETSNAADQLAAALIWTS